MRFKKIVAYLEEKLISDRQLLYDFAQLKIARHKVSDLLAKNSFDKNSEEKLQSILNQINHIHANHAYLEKEYRRIFQRQIRIKS